MAWTASTSASIASARVKPRRQAMAIRRAVEMAQAGLVVVISQHGEDFWHITEHGRKAMEAPKVATTRKVVAGTTVGFYDGKELTRTCQRPGAYDFLQYPSLMGDKRIFRGAL